MNFKNYHLKCVQEQIYIKPDKNADLPVDACQDIESSNYFYNKNDVKHEIKTEAEFPCPMTVINEYEDTEIDVTQILFKTEDIEEPSLTEDHYDPLMTNSDSIIKNENNEPSPVAERSLKQEKERFEKKHPCRTCILLSAKNVTNNILPNIEHQTNCEFCSFLANKAQNYKINFASDTGKTSFSCEVCPYKTLQKSTIKKHVMIHTGEKPFSCDLCHFRAGQKSTIKMHMLTHTGEESFSCDLCPYKGKLKSRLKKHYLTHTNKNNWKDNIVKSDVTDTANKTLACNYCSFTASRTCILTSHILTHREDSGKLFSCELCPYKSIRKFDLKIHYMTHSKEKPFECEFCNYKTSKKRILNKHYASHIRKQVLPCQFCSYTGTKKNLNIHMILHTDENLFSRSLSSIRK